MGENGVTVLKPIGITCNTIEQKMVSYQFLGEDSKGEKYIMTFVCKAFYQPTIDKYLKKLIPVGVDKEEKE